MAPQHSKISSEPLLCPIPPVPDNEAARLDALCTLAILDTDPDPAFDRISGLAATIFESSMACISFVDESRQWLKSKKGIDLVEMPRNIAFCAYTILSREPTVVLDASKDSRFSSNPFVSGQPGIRFYAGAPIVTAHGLNVGSLSIADTKPRDSFSSQQRELLRALADLTVDAVEAHRTNAELRTKEAEAQDRYSLVTSATLDGVWDWDIRRSSVYYSPRWQNIVGLKGSDYSSDLTHWLERVHPDDRSLVDTELQKHLEGATSRFRSEHRVRHGDGSWRWVVVRGLAKRSKSGLPARMAGSLMDVTKDKTSDSLTRLPNRLLLHERLAQLIRRSEVEQKWHFAVLFLDVDRFKQINDRFGHLIGDAMLRSIADRLQDAVAKTRAGDKSIIARFAGDEFVVLLDGVENSSQAQAVAERLHAALSSPIDCEGEQLMAGVSIGIAMATPELRTPESFLQNSDLAMYRAKAAGRGLSAIFDPAMQEETIASLELEAALKQAIAAEQLRILYQPQIDLRTGRLLGCEALVRWQHPHRGLLNPGDFIGLAEDLGIVCSIDLWVMENACSQLARWRRLSRGAGLKMSVNISGQHLSHQGLKEAVEDTLSKHCLPASALCLELTESVLMKDVPGSIRLMKELRAVGVGLHMDDFGSGYSSFKHLYELPFDTLKIDRSFIEKIPTDTQARKIVEGIRGLAHSMRLRVIAEGVETAVQAEMLETIGCDLGQGYYFDRPLDADTFRRKYFDSDDLLQPNQELLAAE